MMDEQAPPVAPEQQTSDVIRDPNTPEIDASRAALVKEWCEKIASAEKKWEPVFKRMREDMQYVAKGGRKEWVDSGSYVVPIINRHLNVSVAALYARNPKAKATLRERLYYQLWNEDPGSLQSEMTAMQATGMPTPIIMEIVQVQQQKDMLKKVAKTLEILFNYFTSEQAANFKLQMKQLVRRTKTVGVGYLWLDFQRLMKHRPEITEQITDISSKIAAIERMAADAQDGKTEEGAAELEKLRLSLADLQRDKDIIVREGPVFDFPRATDIIVDEECTQLRGLIGANWIARRADMTPAKIQERFKRDVRQNFKPYSTDGKAEGTAREKSKARVYTVYDRELQQKFVICEGYPDFLEEPATPTPLLERFWPVFVLTFNDVESEDELFPPSDVNFLKHAQDGYNEARQGLKEHRKANRPKYALAKGQLEQVDKDKLQTHPANALLELASLLPGQKVGDLIQRFEMQPIDPAVYETASYMDDVYRSVGTQEAIIGGTSGDTATEVSVAESGRMASTSSNGDDLDEFLSEVAHSTGQMMLMELSPETVTKIVGPGAAWPQLNRQQIAEDLELASKAGSSGRPNRAAELANLERGMPFLIQIPGLNPNKLGGKYVDLLDLSDDDNEMFLPSLPSIVAMNAMAGKQAQAATGDPASDPNQQGGEGGQNAEQAAQNEPQSQPAYPAGDTPPGV